MLATGHTQPGMTPGPLAPATLVRMFLEAVIAVGTLVASAAFFGEFFDGPYIILALLVFSLTFPGRAPQGTSALSIAREVLTGWIVVVMLLLLLGWATRTLGAFDPRTLVAWAVATPILQFAVQMSAPTLLRRLANVEGVRRNAIIAGAGGLGRRLAERIRGTPYLGVHIAGFFDDRSTDRLEDIEPREMLGSVEELPAYVKRNHVDIIYITLPMASQPRIMRLLDELHDTTASIYFCPDIFLVDLIQARMDTIGGIPVLAVCETPFYGTNAFVKRLSDIVIGGMILIAISPLLALIAAGVKLSSPGPAFFKQRRYGLDGREILVYKFRSMRCMDDGVVVKQATKSDDRVTPFGAFIRRTSLDELPQFINVIQGRMSIVGPRPHAVAHNEQYRKLIKSYMIRHKVRPGITGWAQVNGLRGETETVDKMKARIEYDLDYLRHWSLKLDLQIIWRTLFVVWKKQNAY